MVFRPSCLLFLSSPMLNFTINFLALEVKEHSCLSQKLIRLQMEDKPWNKLPQQELKISKKGKSLRWDGTDSRPGERDMWLVPSALTDPDKKKSHSGKLCKRKKLFMCMSLVKQRSLKLWDRWYITIKDPQSIPRPCTRGLYMIHNVVSVINYPPGGGSWVFTPEPEHVLTHWTLLHRLNPPLMDQDCDHLFDQLTSK